MGRPVRQISLEGERLFTVGTVLTFVGVVLVLAWAIMYPLRGPKLVGLDPAPHGLFLDFGFYGGMGVTAFGLLVRQTARQKGGVSRDALDPPPGFNLGDDEATAMGKVVCQACWALNEKEAGVCRKCGNVL